MLLLLLLLLLQLLLFICDCVCVCVLLVVLVLGGKWGLLVDVTFDVVSVFALLLLSSLFLSLLL